MSINSQTLKQLKRSVRNLINLNNYERFFRPELGSGLRGLLFEPMTELTTQFIKQKIIADC